MSPIRHWFRFSAIPRSSARPRRSYQPTFDAFEDRLMLSGNAVVEVLPPRASNDVVLVAQANAPAAEAEQALSLNDEVLKFVQLKAQLEQRIGDGKCFALIQRALQKAGAKVPLERIGAVDFKYLGYPGYDKTVSEVIGKIVGNHNTTMTFKNMTFKNRQLPINGDWAVEEVNGKVVKLLNQGTGARRTIDLSQVKSGVMGVFNGYGAKVGEGTPGKMDSLLNAQAGDVLLLRNVVFTKYNGAEKVPPYAQFHDHVAVVTSVDAAKREIRVIHQNVKPELHAVEHTLHLDSMRSGRIWVYMPMAKEAAPPPAPKPIPLPQPIPIPRPIPIPLPQPIPIPLPAPKPDKEATKEQLGYLWDVLALTRNALQAPWLCRGFGNGTDAEALAHRPKAGTVGKLATAWALVLAARPLIVKATDLFDQARTVGSPEQGRLVKEGNQLLAQAKPHVQNAMSIWNELWSDLWKRA